MIFKNGLSHRFCETKTRKRVLKLARTASVSYQPPTRESISDHYLPESFKARMKRNKQCYMADIDTAK